MRTKLPAALLLMLSWFLPVAGPAHAAHAVTAQAATEQGRLGGHQPGVRESPLPPATAQDRALSQEAAGGAALPPHGAPCLSLARTAAVPPHGGAGSAASCAQITPARAPPSSAAF
ncbi:MAG TPA: hypothetical protein VKZ82_19570 [Nonomuraea sp.]|uniref:hypothetical protein n=1 Tax=Nonomuraea sp. NPDC049649 TaxID=3155776 RepID=UPI002CC0A260|nr:hypothetical protein [Nonomuraea sp.]